MPAREPRQRRRPPNHDVDRSMDRFEADLFRSWLPRFDIVAKALEGREVRAPRASGDDAGRFTSVIELIGEFQNCPEGPRRGLVASDLILTVGESRLVSPISAWRLPVAASAAMRFRARRSSSVLSAALSLGVTERAMSAP
jgi:hypothetical protein